MRADWQPQTAAIRLCAGDAALQKRRHRSCGGNVGRSGRVQGVRLKLQATRACWRTTSISRLGAPFKKALADGRRRRKPGVAVPESPTDVNPYQAELAHFLNCLETGATPAISPRDGIGSGSHRSRRPRIHSDWEILSRCIPDGPLMKLTFKSKETSRKHVDFINAPCAPPAEVRLSEPAKASQSLSTTQEEADIRRLIRGLKSSNSVRRVADTLFTQPDLLITDTQLLFASLGKLSGFRWKEHVVAAWALSRLSLTEAEKRFAVERLLAALKTRRAWPDDTRLFLKRWFGLSGALSLIFMIFNLPGPMLFLFAAASFILFIPVLFGSAYLNILYLNRFRTQAVTTLGILTEPDSVAALTATLEDGAKWRMTPRGRQLRNAAKTALYSVLPILSTEHYGRLWPSTVPNLCWTVNAVEEPLAVLMLEALGEDWGWQGNTPCSPHRQ